MFVEIFIQIIKGIYPNWDNEEEFILCQLGGIPLHKNKVTTTFLFKLKKYNIEFINNNDSF